MHLVIKRSRNEIVLYENILLIVNNWKIGQNVDN